MRTLPIALIVSCCCTFAPVVSGQQATLSLDAVLAKVRANVTAYRTQVPDFSCDELVNSRRLSGGKVKDEMKIESSFRMTRQGQDGALRETRIKNLVDGNIPKDQKVNPPFSFYGGFADVLGFTDNKCADFRFADQPVNGNVIVILATPKPGITGQPSCHAKGWQRKAFIDPVSFQVLRLEDSQEDIAVGFASSLPFMPVPSGHNNFRLTVDYAPVNIGGGTFWLPRTVTASIADKKRPVSLEYEAHYANYRKFAVTSTIVPTSVDASPK